MRWLLLAGFLCAGCVAGAAPPAETTAAPPIPPGEARLFVYRDEGPYRGLEYVPILLDDHVIGAVGPGKILRRGLPAGPHTLEAKSEGLWPGQAKSATFAAGDTVYAKVESFLGSDPITNRIRLIATNVLVLIDPETARREMRGLVLEASRPH